MQISLPQPVNGVLDPPGTIWAIRALAEARPNGDPRVWLRETLKMPHGVARKAGDLYLWRQTPMVAAVVAVAGALGAVTLPEVHAIAHKRLPEATDEQIKLAALWIYAMQPENWRDARPPQLTDDATIESPLHSRRPCRQHWPMSQGDA